MTGHDLLTPRACRCCSGRRRRRWRRSSSKRASPFRGLDEAHPLGLPAGPVRPLRRPRRSRSSELRKLLEAREHVAIDVDTLRDAASPRPVRGPARHRRGTVDAGGSSSFNRDASPSRPRSRAAPPAPGRAARRSRDGGRWGLGAALAAIRSRIGRRSTSVSTSTSTSPTTTSPSPAPGRRSRTRRLTSSARAPTAMIPDVLDDLGATGHALARPSPRRLSRARGEPRQPAPALDRLDEAGITGRRLRGPARALEPRAGRGAGGTRLRLFVRIPGRLRRPAVLPLDRLAEVDRAPGARPPDLRGALPRRRGDRRHAPITAHLAAVVRAKIAAGEPAFVYGHPERRLGRFPGDRLGAGRCVRGGSR